MVDVSPEELAHLERALVEHRQWCKRQGLELPSALVMLLERTWEARHGQHRPRPVMLPNVSDDRPAGPDDLLNTAGAAARLGVSARTVRRLVAAGQLHPVRIGRATRYRPADLDEFTNRSDRR